MTLAPAAAARTRSRSRPQRAWRRLEAWLWTGPLGHLLGGALDLSRALARYLLARARGRRIP